MIISYDRKRPFKLFIVDICRFSQYNELFSAEVGDQILHELLNRLWRPFGTHLYRINGDVFLGISLSDEKIVLLGERLQRLFTTPVTAGTASLSLQVRIAACSYPDNGATPEELRDAGVHIALDDFGAGYSSLNYLSDPNKYKTVCPAPWDCGGGGCQCAESGSGGRGDGI